MNGGKYALRPKWFEECLVCRDAVLMCPAFDEVIGPYHDGCFGYPLCNCRTSHSGPCTPEAYRQLVENEIAGNGEDRDAPAREYY